MKSNGTCWIVVVWNAEGGFDKIEDQFVITSERAFMEYSKTKPDHVSIEEVKCFS